MRPRPPLLALLLAVVGLALPACAYDDDDGSSAPATSSAAPGRVAPTTAPPTTVPAAAEGDGAAGGEPPAAGASTTPMDCDAGVAGRVVVSVDDGRLRVAADDGSPVDAALDTSRLGPDGLDALVAALEADERQIRISIPDAAGPRPVLLEFHGYSSSASENSVYSGLMDRATASGYLAVAVDGRDDPRRWELMSTDAEPTAVAVSDVAVVDAIVDILVPSFCADPEQLHAAGLSNGSVFSAVLACHSRHRIRAVGSVAFTTGRAGCDEDRQVPTIAFHGTADLIVPYAGRSVPLISAVLRWDLQPADEAMAEKAALNGCDGYEEERLGLDVLRRTWQGCDAATVFYRVDGGGHGWPGAVVTPSALLATTDTVDASELIVEFFEQH